MEQRTRISRCSSLIYTYHFKDKFKSFSFIYNHSDKVFGKNKNERLLSIEELGEKPSIEDAIGSFRILDITSIPKNEPILLKENVTSVGDRKVRIDYIMAPKNAIHRLGQDRIGIDTAYARRFDDLLWFLTRFSEHFFNERPQRLITDDGWEMYLYKGIPLLELQSNVCTRCKSCHEQAPVYHGPGPRDVTIYRHPVRDIRTYKIHSGIQTLFYKTGMAIASVEHPCEVRSLQEILFPNYQIVDPIVIKIVFPQDLKI